MKMKIGYDAKRVFHNFRGLGNYGRTLLEGMARFYPENTYTLYTPPITDKRGIEWKEQNRDSGFEIVTPHFNLGRKLSAIWRGFFIGKCLEEDHIDLYHGLSHELPLESKSQKSNLS